MSSSSSSSSYHPSLTARRGRTTTSLAENAITTRCTDTAGRAPSYATATAWEWAWAWTLLAGVALFITAYTHIEIATVSPSHATAKISPSLVSPENEVQRSAPAGAAVSSSGLVLPNVLLAGRAKSGTTAVASWLFSTHPVCSAQTFGDEPNWYAKEVHFFDKEERFKLGPEFYASRFARCNSSRLVMDATPYYSIPEKIVDWYNRYLPSLVSTTTTDVSSTEGRDSGLKVMLILREPVSRELSLYNHNKHVHQLKRRNRHQAWSNMSQWNSFDEYVDRVLLPNNETLISNPVGGKCSISLCLSFYSVILARWFDRMPRNQTLLLSYQEFRSDPATFMRRIEDFLGLPPHGDRAMPSGGLVDNPVKTSLPSCRSRNKLTRFFQPSNEDLYALLEQNPGPPMEQRPFPEFELADCEE